MQIYFRQVSPHVLANYCVVTRQLRMFWPKVGCRSIILYNRPLSEQGWEKFPPQRLEINWILRDEDSTMARTGTLDTGGDPPQPGSGPSPTPWPHIDSGPCYASIFDFEYKTPQMCWMMLDMQELSGKNVTIFSCKAVLWSRKMAYCTYLYYLILLRAFCQLKTNIRRALFHVYLLIKSDLNTEFKISG